MGDPVQIIDLAETMIRLSGLEPERDIAIEIVGARPGEKFHEDLFNPYERPQPTPAQKILRAEREPLDPAWVEETFGEINLLVLEGDAAALAEHVSELSGTTLARAGVPAPEGRNVDCGRPWDRFPFAFSVHHFINSVGADAGFASIIGLAILVLLYFAQARETASLREQADEAAQRVQQLEARLAQLARSRRRPQRRSRRAGPPRRPAAPAVGPRPATPARSPAGGGGLRSRRGSRGIVPVGARRGWRSGADRGHDADPGADAGRRRRAAGPAAERAARRATDGPDGRAGPPSSAVVGATAAASGQRRRAGTSRRRPSARPAARSQPSRRALGRSRAARPRTGRTHVRRPGRAGRRERRSFLAPRAERPRRLADRTRDRGRARSSLLLVAASSVVLVVTSTIGGKHLEPRRLAQRRRRPRHRPLQRWPFNPPSVTVAVLNGTATSGLAGRTSKRLVAAGYKQGPSPRRPTRRSTTTTVAYLPGYRPRRACAVATALKLRPRSVQPVDPARRRWRVRRRRACAANVVVTVGADLTTRRRPTVDLLDLPDRSCQAARARRHARARPGAVARRGRRADRGRRRLRRHRQARAGAPRWPPATSRRKLERYREHGIPVVLGGTLTELAIAQDRLEELIAWLHELGLGALRDLRRDDRPRARAQARADRAAGAGLHRPLRGRLQGRHRRDHGALPLGRADARRSSRRGRGR